MTTHKKEKVQRFFETVLQLRRLGSSVGHGSAQDRFATMLQMQALDFLKEHEKATVSELSGFLQMSSSSIAQFVDRLEKSKLVKRAEDKDDRRIVRLSLSGEGRKEIAEKERKILEKMGKILSHISESDLDNLLSIQTKLIEALKAENK
jgi:DNA-binding MarR family transcriptional regulator